MFAAQPRPARSARQRVVVSRLPVGVLVRVAPKTLHAKCSGYGFGQVGSTVSQTPLMQTARVHTMVWLLQVVQRAGGGQSAAVVQPVCDPDGHDGYSGRHSLFTQVATGQTELPSEHGLHAHDEAGQSVREVHATGEQIGALT